MLKQILVLCFNLILITAIIAQKQTGSVKGRVLDSKTLEPLPYSSVYINFTTIGVYANPNGDFELSNIPFGEYELIISHVGNQTYQSKIVVKDTIPITRIVKLIPVVLKDIEITAKKDVKWEKQLQKFKKLFFGDSPHTKFCKIYNPWVLEFSEDKLGNLIAKASAPLELENLSLGYRISYQLKDFVAMPKAFTIAGTVRFEEFIAADSITANVWAERRAKVYKGSYRHLFKSMVEGKMNEEGFRIYEDRSQTEGIIRASNFLTNLNSVVFEYPLENMITEGETSNDVTIRMPPRLEVHYTNRSAPTKVYNNVPNPVSWLDIRGGVLKMTRQGILLNPSSMVAMGAMGEARIAEILPNDYQPPVNTEKKNRLITSLSSLSALIEKPYLHTDRSYYYPHEEIWFKGYMNYFKWIMQDSLSRVLYVDMINSTGKVLETKAFRIKNGQIEGHFPIPKGISKGDYALRAYTRWMLNFDESFVFVKPIKILDYNEIVKMTNLNSIDSIHNSIRIVTDKIAFKPREKISLKIDPLDFYEESKIAQLSVSVTDIQGSVNADNEKNVLNAFPISVSVLPDTTVKPTYLIQNGIEVKGVFKNKRGKQDKGIVTVIQDDSEDRITIATDEDGHFLVPNLLLYDTTQYRIQGKTERRDKIGTVVIDSIRPLPSAVTFEPLNLEVIKPEYVVKDKRFDMPEQLPARFLETVTVTRTRLKEIKPMSEIKVDADVTIDEEWIRRVGEMGDVLSLLQKTVSGLRVVMLNSKGIITRLLVLGGPNGILNPNTEPLVLIDNFPLDTKDETAADRLASMSASQIQRVEVIKFGNGSAYGARGGNGVINIFTNRNLSSLDLDPIDRTKFQILKITGYSSPAQFISPDYSKTESEQKKSDYRTTIYWNPKLFTDGTGPAKVSFYAADTPTQYRIMVEGVDAEGKPVRGEKIITIVPE